LNPSSSDIGPPAAAGDPRADLVKRVAGSAAFHRTWRLRELLLFLCDHALREPGRPLREQEIAEAVFGRGHDFDPILDGLVRVQVAQLRKRLRLYFGAEGASEVMVVEIAPGSYTAVFRPRSVGPEPPAPADDEDEHNGHRPAGRRWTFALAAAVLALVVAAAGLVLHTVRRPAEPRLPGPPRPSVEALWRQLFGNGKPARIILADGSLTVFLDVTQRELSASAYQRGDFAARYAGSETSRPRPDPSRVALAHELLPQSFTSVVDADLACRAGALLTAAGVTGEVLRARHASPDTFRSANAVITGPRRANPWVELFEGPLNFEAHHDRVGNVGSFTNRSPGAGEGADYTAVRDELGFCRVAHVPNLDATGSVLLLTGTDVPSTQACVDFVTREAEIAGLRQRLQLRPHAPFPPFEVLLRVRIVAGAVGSFETVAHRVH
jgi:hypothetical protein